MIDKSYCPDKQRTFLVQHRRVGEATNPGPYTYGGATSSGVPSALVGESQADAEAGDVMVGGAALMNSGQPYSWGGPVTAWDDRQAHWAGLDESKGPPGREDEVIDDETWNKYLDNIVTTRGGMSPAEVAYDWSVKQQQEAWSKEWADFERELGGPACGPACDKPSVSREAEPSCCNQELSQARRWRPPIEADSKKAAKWRKRMLKIRDAETSVAAAVSADEGSADGKSGSPAADFELSAEAKPDGSACSSRKTQTRASRKSKVLSF